MTVGSRCRETFEGGNRALDLDAYPDETGKAGERIIVAVEVRIQNGEQIVVAVGIVRIVQTEKYQPPIRSSGRIGITAGRQLITSRGRGRYEYTMLLCEQLFHFGRGSVVLGR